MSDQAKRPSLAARLEHWEDVLEQEQVVQPTEMGSIERTDGDDPDMTLSDDESDDDIFEDIEIPQSETPQDQSVARVLFDGLVAAPVAQPPEIPHLSTPFPSLTVCSDRTLISPSLSSDSSERTEEDPALYEKNYGFKMKVIEIYADFTRGEYLLYKHPIYQWYRCNKPSGLRHCLTAIWDEEDKETKRGAEGELKQDDSQK